MGCQIWPNVAVMKLCNAQNNLSENVFQHSTNGWQKIHSDDHLSNKQLQLK
jgi:hypothetical protein